jgi:hypothetical protein
MWRAGGRGGRGGGRRAGFCAKLCDRGPCLPPPLPPSLAGCAARRAAGLWLPCQQRARRSPSTAMPRPPLPTAAGAPAGNDGRAAGWIGSGGMLRFAGGGRQRGRARAPGAAVRVTVHVGPLFVWLLGGDAPSIADCACGRLVPPRPRNRQTPDCRTLTSCRRRAAPMRCCRSALPRSWAHTAQPSPRRPSWATGVCTAMSRWPPATPRAEALPPASRGTWPS